LIILEKRFLEIILEFSEGCGLFCQEVLWHYPFYAGSKKGVGRTDSLIISSFLETAIGQKLFLLEK